MALEVMVCRDMGATLGYANEGMVDRVSPADY